MAQQQPKRSRQNNRRACFHYREELLGVQEKEKKKKEKMVTQIKNIWYYNVYREELWTQNTYLRHPWHHVIQFATTTIHYDILLPIRETQSQNRQHWT